MPDYSWMLYDTAVFGTSAGVTSSLFQVSEGGDATHTSDFTNSRGAGVIPTNEKFLINWIGVTFESNIVEADVDDWYVAGYVRIFIANLICFHAPILPLIAHSAFSGVLAQAAAANRALVNRLGNGYNFRQPLSLKGGDAFKVEVYQGTLLATASMRVKILLDGILTRP